MRLRTYEVTDESGAHPQLGVERDGHVVAVRGVRDVAEFFALPGDERDRLAGDAEAALAKGLGAPAESRRTLLPVLDPRKIICVGLNYRDHAAEQSLEVPKAPGLFPKYTSSLVAHGEPIELPRESVKVDYEAELVLVIGSHADHVSLDDAWSVVGGLTIGNDVSVRDYQGATTQWMNGKIFDRTTPVGPVVVTPDDFADPADLEIWLEIGGEVLQHSRTSRFVFDVPQMIEYITRMTTLEAGDLVFTGTPGGVGFLRKPRRYLQDGETVTVYVEGIGTLVNRVQAPARGAVPEVLPKPRREHQTT